MVRVLWFEDDGIVPNNPALPAVIVPGAIAPVAARVQEALRRNGWRGIWTWTVFDYHHYHPDGHEALVCLTGWADVRLGGTEGETVRLSPGDLCVLPAGTGHCRERASPDFQVMGAYPAGTRQVEIRRATEENHRGTPNRISAVPVPGTCPVFGTDGPVMRHWVRRH
ncbi:MAG: cupin domain-containing protein [Pseudomonadota bacterium]